MRAAGCKDALLQVRTVTPKGRITEKLYSQSLCSIYVYVGRCSKCSLHWGPVICVGITE